MEYIPDDPIIRRIEETGYGYDVRKPICPVCGNECSIVYKAFGEIVGCDECLTGCDAYDEDECFMEDYE